MFFKDARAAHAAPLPSCTRTWPSPSSKPTAGEVQALKLGDDEQLAAVLLEGQVAEPLEDLRHLLGAPAGRRSTRRPR